jgi:hypothetical protein
VYLPLLSERKKTAVRRGDPHVEVDWRSLNGEDDAGWNLVRCLYGYLAPDMREILYIGKSWGVSVRGRWSRSAKSDFWDDLEAERKIARHYVLLGQIALFGESRLSRQLLADVESLLIFHLAPWGNIQSTRTRISRPGLVVRCVGAWPVKQQFFEDE